MKDSTRRFVLLKLTTDRHEASRGLFAIAELLVLLLALFQCPVYEAIQLCIAWMRKLG